MGESRIRTYFGTTCGRRSKGPRRIPRSIRQKTRYITSTTTCLTVHLYKKGSASTTGIQDPDVEEKALLRSKSQASGMSSHCRKRLSMLTTSFSRTGSRFHVTHYGGCAVLFNEDTFFPDVKVKSIYLHDIRRELPDKVVEGDSGWVIQGVLSLASFRRQPPSGQKSFTVMFVHINTNFANKALASERS